MSKLANESQKSRSTPLHNNQKPYYKKNTIDIPVKSRIPRPSSNLKSQTKDNQSLPREQLRKLLTTAKAIRRGDFSVRMPLLEEGPISEIGEVLNDIIEINENMTNEFIRVRNTVGKEGKMAERVSVNSVKGAWATSVDSINSLIGDLVQPTFEVARVITSVAKGDLSQKISLEIDGRAAKGEFLRIGTTVNAMVDQLNSFASEVTRVAKEVGTEGKLGGQAEVPGVSGTWKDLTDNVNQLAGNLTSQVRAIAEVSTAVTKGDLTRSITVKAQGEVAALKDNINQMIGNLKDTTQKNNEQDWLKTNLAKFSGMIQGQRSITSVAQLIMSELTPLVNAQHGTFFMLESDTKEISLNLIASYAFTEGKNTSSKYRMKEGLIGQCAFEKKRILLNQPPEDYIRITSSVVEQIPKNIVMLPVLFEGELKAVIELASTRPFTPNYIYFLDQLMDSVGVVLNMISSSMRTEELLQELKRSNAELEAQAKELEEKAKLLEVKNQEVELASKSLEEKAEQLSLISKYKSEFLANMSHELRTPLNSLLILSKTLADNKNKNLSEEQVRFASTVHSAGQDLLALINEILDLSKVEAGKMPINPKAVFLQDIQAYLEQTFRPVAEHKGLDFSFEISKNLPKNIFTDENRLQQILKNLLSNAFKFTEKGKVRLEIGLAPKRKFEIENLNICKNSNIVFSVIDSGIGISASQQKLIFEAFQQADGTTSRKYGGTGLGLTISREIARLLGGIIEVESETGKGSKFSLYLPPKYMGQEGSTGTSAVELQTLVPPLPLEADFTGYNILVIDDDVRNVFALTSILKSRGMNVTYAENGRQGIHTLQMNPRTDLVLMDTMMPEMDGLEATREIRKIQDFKNLPIISLTAKAMKGDREKCLEAGASDYITKPVDEQHLLSVMYNWLKEKRVQHEVQ